MYNYRMKRSKKQYLLPIILATLIMVFLVLYVASKPKNQIINNQIPGFTLTDGTPLPTPKITDVSDENGAYKNNVYGFELKYPADVFNKLGVNTANAVERTSSDQYSQYLLAINVYKYQEEDKTNPGYQPTLYFAAIDKNVGEKISEYDYKNNKFVLVGTKIANISSGTNKGVFYTYKEMFEDYRLGINYYSADWLKGDMIFSIKVASMDPANLAKFKPQFEKMIQSFKFVELK